MTDALLPAGSARTGYRAVLANHEFRALWFAHVTSILGDQLTRIVLASVVLERTGSVALSALSFAATFLPWLLGGPLLSLFADRCPRRTVMVACDVARGLLVLVMALPAVPVWGLFVLTALVALLGPPFEAARGATIPEVVPAALYPVAQALSMASLQAAQLLGFALGGLLVTLHPGAWTLTLDAGTFLLSALVLHRYVAWRPGAETAADSSARTWVRDSGEGLRVVARTLELRRLLALSTVVAAVTVLPESLAIAQAEVLGRTPFVAGLLCAAVPLGTVIGAALAGRPAPGGDRLALVRPLGLLACAACAACLLEPGLTGLFVLWTLAGVGAGSLLPANVAFVLRVDPAVRGRALSVAQVVLQVGQGVAVGLGGLLAGVVGPAAAVGWAGVLGLVGVAALSLRWPASLRGSSPTADGGPFPVRSATPPRARGSAAGRVRVFALVVAAAAAALWWSTGRHALPATGPIDLPWWALLAAVAAAQGVNVHFQVRRHAHGVSLCHLPILLGLLCTGPLAFVLARTLGGSLAMAVVRRQRGLKLVLNTASYALEATVAVSLLHVLQAQAGWPMPAALYVAMVLADLTSFTVVSSAIMMFERRLDVAARSRTLVLLLPINVVATSFGLVAVAALWRGGAYLVLLVGVTAALVLFYRTYARLRGRHLDLGLLQDLAVSLPALTPGSQELCDVLERTRQLLVADRAALWLPNGSLVLARHDAVPAVVAAGARAPGPVLISRRWRTPAWSCLTADVVFDEGRQRAVLVVDDRLGAVRPFSLDDQRLLHAAAALLGGGLDRGADRQRLLDAARRDPLTGLWTLPEGSRRAAEELRAPGVEGLLVLDVIGLQDVNDSLGHDAGDALLRLTARRLQDHVGAGAVTARIGGDELMVLLREGDPGPEQLARSVAGTVELAGARFELRIRAGYCSADEAGQSFDRLLRNAQATLSRAAVAGTRYRTWTPELTVDPTRRLRLAGDLQGALSRGEVFPVFQPLCRASDRVVVGAEALARWRHPDLGAVPPDEFVAIAEQTGLIGELTGVVLDRALRQARAWQDQGVPLRVSVNLSPRSLTDGDLAAAVDAALRRHGLAPDALLLEITESTIMSNVERASAVLAALRAAGVHTALDDFGTGHSSLTQLRAIPVDEVKLDRSFLTGVDGDRAARRVVATAVALCHDLGKTVVAEGVEDEATADFLRDSGVDVLQGYFLGRPLPAEQWPDGLVEAAVRSIPPIPAQGRGALDATPRRSAAGA